MALILSQRLRNRSFLVSPMAFRAFNTTTAAAGETEKSTATSILDLKQANEHCKSNVK